MANYNDESIRYLIELKESVSEDQLAEKWNDKYGRVLGDKTYNALRKKYHKVVSELSGTFEDDTLSTTLTSKARAQKESKRLKKQVTALAELHMSKEDIDEAFRLALKEIRQSKIKIAKPKKNKKKPGITFEPLLSDIHFGLKTDTDDLDSNRRKMRLFTSTFMSEKSRLEKNYNIDEVVVLLNGDLIQSATMRKGADSACDMTNAEQLAVAITSLYEDLILPIAKLGNPMRIIGMSGNHDREQFDRFTIDPGKHYYTYTIYSALKQICKSVGLKNINFIIPTKAYYVYEIYGRSFLVEHGDLVSKPTPDCLEKQLMKRSAQVGKILHGIRIGHFHNDLVANCGRYIVNGGFPSNDHFGEMLGYKSRPCQLINYYVDSERETPYYHSFAVNLE